MALLKGKIISVSREIYFAGHSDFQNELRLAIQKSNVQKKKGKC